MMNYYIQGDEANADKIKAAFEKLGVASNADKYNYKNRAVLYFTAGGMIHIVDANGSWANIIKTHPDYQELELPVEFKNGDIIGFNDLKNNDGSYTDWIGIYKQAIETNQHLFHCVIPSCRSFRVGGMWRVFTAYPATKEQRDLLFAKMRESGYEWDADKKELRKIKPHYDIKNFQPFDKVLTRDTEYGNWNVNLFSYYIDDNDARVIARFRCMNSLWSQCIPYNDDTKHLLGTADMCDEQYINW